MSRSRVWRLFVPLNVLLVGCVLFFAGLRISQPGTVFYYTEGPVLGSLAALQSGDLSDLYPSDGWVEPPVVLTLYPPAYFVAAATVDRWLGSEGTFTGLRIVSAAALLGVLILLIVHTVCRRAPLAWILALAAAVLWTSGVYRVVAGAQADSLALLFTWLGVAAALGATGSRVRSGVLPVFFAGTAFLLAFFTKQSFVAAPVALVLSLVLERRIAASAILAAALATSALIGMFLLNEATSGGYLANTLGALTGGSGWSNLAASIADSRPEQWLLIIVAVLFALRGRLRPGFPELYLLGSAMLHTMAMLKAGSSVNYLFEPTFALLLLAVTREYDGGAPRREVGPEKLARVRVILPAMLAAALAITAAHAWLRELGTTRAWLAGAGEIHMATFEGHPLVDAAFFPAVLEHGGRPWINDPFAFGVLEETGQWDPARLIEDLESRIVPFALTLVDVGTEPAPSGVGTRELLFAYFWRSRPVWTALNEHYDLSRSGPLTLFLPREEPQP
ncbi:MAG: hypothetical protein KJO44_02905 [Gemmatimonadetes bacterium]|nr:hypothetical protein [Gemmatimonadota bacterium]